MIRENMRAHGASADTNSSADRATVPGPNTSIIRDLDVTRYLICIKSCWLVHASHMIVSGLLFILPNPQHLEARTLAPASGWGFFCHRNLSTQMRGLTRSD